MPADATPPSVFNDTASDDVFVELDDMLRRYVDLTPDAVAIMDGGGVIVLVNGRMEHMFGYRRAELVGGSIERVAPGLFRSVDASAPEPYLLRGDRRSTGVGAELFGRRRDGSEFPVEISLSPVRLDGGLLFFGAIRDVTQRHAAQEARARLASIVDSSDDAIIGSDVDGLISSWNPAACHLFGYPPAEAIGRPLAMLLPSGQEHEMAEMLATLRAGDRVPLHDGVRRRRDGSTVEVSISMSAVRDPRGRLVGASKVFRDIRERRKAEKDLAEAKDAAESTSRALEAFSYSVAHDLRTPLRAMDGVSQLLLLECENKLSETGQYYLQRIRSAATVMADLIDGLLALAGITRKELDAGVVDLTSLAASIVNDLRAQAPERDVDVDLEPGLNAHGDAPLIRNVLQNLIGNAWKFTFSTASPRIVVGRDDQGFFVSDNGAGFDMAYASKLFAVFQRLHGPQEFSGHGIGLATAHRIIERHGGRVWAEGVVNQGAVFHFTLPEGDS